MAASELSDTSFIQAWLEAEDLDQRCEFLRAHHLQITDQTVQAMKTALSKRLRQNPSNALEIADSIIYAADLSQQPMHRAWALMAKGNALRYLAQYQEAIDTFDMATSICLAENRPVEAARPQMAKIAALANLGDLREALQIAEKIRRVFEAHGDIAGAAAVDNEAAIAAYKLGNYSEAMRLFDRARQGFETTSAASQASLTRVELNRSVALRNLDHFAEAETAAVRAHSMADQQNMDIVAARADQSLAITRYLLGQYNEALKLLDRARQVFVDADLRREVLVANLFATNCYLALNRYSKVLDLVGEAEQELAHFGMHYEVAWAAYSCALAYMGLGQLETAADALARSRLGFAQIANRTWMARVDVQWAALNLQLGACQAALSNASRASAVFEEQGLLVEKTQADLVTAEALIRLERNAEARDISRAALQIALQLDIAWLAYRAHHLLGRLEELAGKQTSALEHYEACATYIERLRGQVAVELRSSFLADKSEVYEDIVCLRLASQETALAFKTVERAKSRTLVEMLAQNLDIRVKVRRESDRDLVAHVERLRQECQWYYNRLNPFSERESAETGPTQEEQTRLRQGLKNCEKQLADMLIQLQVRSAEYTQDADLWSVQAELPQPYLDKDTLLLEYFIARGEVMALSVTAEDIVVHRHLTTLSGLNRLLSLLHFNLNRLSPVILSSGALLENEWANLHGLLAQLHNSLISPFADRLGRFDRMIIVPHGRLHYLPFHALFDGKHYLLEQSEISYMPSSSLLRFHQDETHMVRHPASALIVGYSLKGVLPHVLTEVKQVAQRLSASRSLLEEQATRANLETLARTAGIIHLATHGEFRADAPLFSPLYLADGPLTATDVFNLQLKASLVTLSACQSGASMIGGGDELVGFSRAFLYAGAASLLLSLWRVEDQATAHLMDRFYRGLLEGQRKPAALRQAQLAFLSGEEGDSYRHPFFWAPFFLVGNRNQVVNQ
jgi:tetratricopeptide (TPR) repeat protein